MCSFGVWCLVPGVLWAWCKAEPVCMQGTCRCCCVASLRLACKPACLHACRMSVTLQVPSQHTQRSLRSNSRTGQPTAAWVTGSSTACDTLEPGTQQQQPLPCHGQQQGGSAEPPAADLASAAGAVGVEGAGQPLPPPVLQKLSLCSRNPQWNNSLRSWCLNFNGRVSAWPLPSYGQSQAELPVTRLTSHVV